MSNDHPDRPKPTKFCWACGYRFGPASRPKLVKMMDGIGRWVHKSYDDKTGECYFRQKEEDFYVPRTDSECG